MSVLEQFGNTVNEGLSEWLGVGQEKAAATAVPGTHQQKGNAENADGSNLEQQKQEVAEKQRKSDLLKWGMIGGGVVVFLLIVVLVVRK